MGGAACTVGNITPAAEYNIWCDPEAARMVFRSGLPVEMVGWELCMGEACLLPEEMKHYKEVVNTPFSHFVVDCNAHALKTNQEWLGQPGIGLPDPVAMAVALEPDLARISRHYVEVECDGTFTRGMTVVDKLNVAGDVKSGAVAMWKPHRDAGAPKTGVCWEIDIPRWKALLLKSVQ